MNGRKVNERKKERNAMKKRLNYDASGDEEDYVKKCMTCKKSYTRQDESDTRLTNCSASAETDANTKNTKK